MVRHKFVMVWALIFEFLSRGDEVNFFALSGSPCLCIFWPIQSELISIRFELDWIVIEIATEYERNLVNLWHLDSVEQSLVYLLIVLCSNRSWVDIYCCRCYNRLARIFLEFENYHLLVFVSIQNWEFLSVNCKSYTIVVFSRSIYVFKAVLQVLKSTLAYLLNSQQV